MAETRKKTVDKAPGGRFSAPFAGSWLRIRATRPSRSSSTTRPSTPSTASTCCSSKRAILKSGPPVEQDQAPPPVEDSFKKARTQGCRCRPKKRTARGAPEAMVIAMIQQQNLRSAISDNTAKIAMCIKVLRGSSSKGKFKRKVAHIGDVIYLRRSRRSRPGGEIQAGRDHPLRGGPDQTA